MVAGMTQVGVTVVQDGYVVDSGTFATLTFEDVGIAASDDVAMLLKAHYCVKELNEDLGDNIVTGYFSAAIQYVGGTPTIISSTDRDAEGSLSIGAVNIAVSSDDIILKIDNEATQNYQCLGAFEIYAVSYEIV